LNEFLNQLLSKVILIAIVYFFLFIVVKGTNILCKYFGRNFENKEQRDNKYISKETIKFLGIFQFEREHTTKRWWFGFIFSLAILVLLEYGLDLNILEEPKNIRPAVTFFAGLYLLKLILLYFIYQLIKARPRKEEQIVDKIEDIEKLKENIKGSLIVRVFFVIFIIFSCVAFYCLFVYFAFNKPGFFEDIFVVGFFGIILYWGEFIFLLFVEFYIQEVDARRITEIGNIVLYQGGDLSGWKRLEYNLAKKITERVTKRIEEEKKKAASKK
jgi:hypothetical protein